jgi:ribonuclease G
VIERANNQSCLVGNIYKGRVCRVLPGMQAGFVEIGLERTAFLHLAEMSDPHLLRHSNEQTKKPESISDVLREGQTLLVQIIKEPLGTKGARLTTQIKIPSRYVVLLPYSSNMIGISSRIESVEERQRLKEIALQHLGIAGHTLVETAGDDNKTLVTQSISPQQRDGYGFIIRTAAEGATEKQLCADMDFLSHLWTNIKQNELYASPRSLVHQDLPLALRTVRDLIGSSVDRVKIDSRETFQEVMDFAQKFIPDLVPLLEHYQGERLMFDLYAIDKEITQALKRKVSLKSGGYLVIDQTEAMTTIDVNTGTYVGSRNLAETVLKTNLQAAQAIARQLRLRNLGGMIILDFIDMQEPEHKRQVLHTLEKCLERDHAKSFISQVSALGLVQMTRRRTRESLEHVLCQTCPTCGGRGSIKTAETVCYEIFRAIIRDAKRYETQQLLVQASQKVVELMLNEESATVSELEALTGCAIRFQVETSYKQEQYNIIPSPL